MKTLTHIDIIKILKSLKVGPHGEAPIRMFCMIVKTYQINKDELNIFKKCVSVNKLFNIWLSCYDHQNGTKDYYCPENLNKIEDFAKKYNGGIIKLF